MNEIKNIKITDLISAPDNPFKVTMDSEMERLIESIAETGVIAPIIARPTDKGKYEIVSGHRRKFACEYLGIKSVPTIIKELDRNEAVIFLVDSNLQRENILPSEKAFAYKMKLDALSAQGKRTDLTSCQVGTKLRADEKMAASVNESARTIQRFIRLTYLVPPFLDMVDEHKVAFNPAVELSYLTSEEQVALLDAMDSEQSTPSLSQAQRLKKFSQEGSLSEDIMRAILSEEKKPEVGKITLSSDKLRRYFPKSYTPQQMEQTIFRLLEQWQRRRQRDLER